MTRRTQELADYLELKADGCLDQDDSESFRNVAAILKAGAMVCPDCHGSGWLADNWPGMFIPPEHVQCKRCDGTGGILVYEPQGVKP